MKNILLIGRIGSGKSALANLLVNEEAKIEGNFEEIFPESDSSVGELENKSEKVKINGVDYHIIDTVGIGNVKLTEGEILSKIAEACYECKEGINQIFFVIGGRFSLKEIKFYNIMKKVLFDENITRYTTIVRTKFHNFRDSRQCEEDSKSLREESKKSNKKIRKMVDLCNKIIYIDNPSLSSADQEEIISCRKRKKDSQKLLLEHLATCQDTYKPDNLELINKVFTNCGDEKSRDKFIKLLDERIERIKNQSFLKRSSEKIKTKILKKQLESAEELTDSSLQAFIEIADNCKQM